MDQAQRLDETTRQAILSAQRNERTEHLIYSSLAKVVKEPHNAQVLRRIAGEELEHSRFWRQYSQQDAEPDRVKARWFVFLARTLGLTFSIKLMERGEEQAQEVYARIAQSVPEAGRIVDDEDRHEHELIAMIDEERLRYVGSMVLGLSDALVELTGALAGFTLAMQNTRLIGMAGLITGIAASLSMGASEYLSTKTEESDRDPKKASLYTGAAYVLTVVLLIAPFFLLDNYLPALGWALLDALLVILVFTYYVSVAKDLSFRRRFLEMVGISFGVALVSFAIGFVVGEALDIDI